MIVAERKAKVVIRKMDCFGEAMPDERLTAPSENKVYRLREAILQSRKLGRPAKYEKMSEEQFLIKAKELGFKKIVDYRVVNKEGIKGWLIWDYRVWNEICFVDFRHLKSESLFKGMNDGKTKEKFEKLLRKYAMH